jgi:hypothetical protein
MLTNEEMESRVPTLAPIVGQANAHDANGKSNKQQIPHGIPEFLLAFGLDVSSPKPTNSSKEIFLSPNLFVQLFVNAAHKALERIAWDPFDRWFWILPSRPKYCSLVWKRPRPKHRHILFSRQELVMLVSRSTRM